MARGITTRLGMVSLLGLAVLFSLYGLKVISSSVVLTGLGVLALLGYWQDRAGSAALLPPAGVLIGVGAGATLADLANGLPLVWVGQATLFAVGLLGVYWTERRHTWALICGSALLLLAGVTVVVVAPVIAGILAGLVVGGLAVSRHLKARGSVALLTVLPAVNGGERRKAA